MTDARLTLCCSPAERAFVRRLSSLGDKALLKEAERVELQARRDSSKRGRWWVSERLSNFAALELLDRGYHKTERWVRA